MTFSLIGESVAAQRVWKTILLFGLVGPVVGVFMFCLLIFVFAALSNGLLAHEGTNGLLGLAGMLLLFGYPAGAMFAGPAGVIVAIFGTLVGRVPFWLGPLSGLVAFVGVGLAFQHFGTTDSNFFSTDGALILICPCVAAGFVCGLLTRRFIFGQKESEI